MKILATAALISFKEEERKKEYINSIDSFVKIANQYKNSEVLVIESTGNYIPSFFEDFIPKENVVYTKTNNPLYRNKGVNEFLSVGNGLCKFHYDDKIDLANDCIIKITGRYQFEDLDFIDKAIKLIEVDKTHDVVAYHHPDGQIFTGCMAMRASCLLDFSSTINYPMIEQYMINVERCCRSWIDDKADGKPSFFIDRLGVVGQCALGNPFRW